MLEELKHRVYEANMLLPQYGLVTFTWGNASELDQKRGIFAIKPSGVDYDKLRPEDMVLIDLEGKKGRGAIQPVLGYPDPSGAVPCLFPDRRHRTHALGLRHQLGPSRAVHSLLRHDTCGLHLWRGTLCAKLNPGRN